MSGGDNQYDVDIRDSQFAQVGPNNTQNIDQSTHYHGPVTFTAPQHAPAVASFTEKNIPIEIAARYFNRKQLCSRVTARLAKDKTPVIFLVGQYEDWHDGMWERLSKNHHETTPEGYVCAKIDWEDQGDQELAEYDLWNKACAAFGHPQTGGDITELKAKVQDYLAEITRFKNSGRILLRYKIADEPLHNNNLALIKNIVSDWQNIQDAIEQKSHHPVHIGLLFSVIETPKKSSWLRSLFSKTSSTGEQTKAHIENSLPNAAIEILNDVGKKDISEWLNMLKAFYNDDIDKNKWWINLESQMERQFEDDTHLLAHGHLRDKLKKDSAFVDALNYKISD